MRRIRRFCLVGLLVVDAADGPQAQTRFVLRKALEAGAKPIVVINKIDRENANPKGVLDQVFELFMALKATDEQLDFPFVYCSAKGGYAKLELDHASGQVQSYVNQFGEASRALNR